jgi:hypothetical protein
VAHACNSSTQKLRQEDPELEVSMDYTERPCLKNQNQPNKHK